MREVQELIQMVSYIHVLRKEEILKEFLNYLFILEPMKIFQWMHIHIGTNKLPNIIKSMRNCIIDNGGEVHFNSKLTDINYSNGRLKNIHINDKLAHASN